jgi:putative membrane protein
VRFLYFVFLLTVAGCVVLFALQNQQELTLTFVNQTLTANVALIIGIAYLLGMLSGWTIVGMLRRSVARVTEPEDRQYAVR